MNAIPLRTHIKLAAFICLALVATFARAQQRRQPSTTRPKATQVKAPPKQPQPAPLRAANSTDVVAVNTEGTVFALDGTNGSALWTARYRPNARRGEEAVQPSALFTPVIMHATEDAPANVLVAYDGGVRALEG